MSLDGTAVYAGVVVGQALLVGHERRPVHQRALSPEEVTGELARFDSALAESRRQLEELSQRVLQAVGEEHAAIFQGHLSLLDDPAVLAEVHLRISGDRQNAEFAYQSVVDGYCEMLGRVEDPYISGRVADLRDVSGRVVRELMGYEAVDLSSLAAPCIIVADDLSPSDTASIDRKNVLGFITCIGSRTCHTAIMARAMGLPTVVGVADATSKIKSGDLLVVDGGRGRVTVSPSDAQLAVARTRMDERKAWVKKIRSEASLPTETVDGYHVRMAANVELPEEIPELKKNYGVGVGLFRSEFMFVNGASLEDEEAQYETYRQVAEEIHPQSVIFRTLDLGGDKFLSLMDLPVELNPFLGMRALRFCLSRPATFRVQLRAILRASAHGKVRMMFPMVTALEELLQALAILEDVKEELHAEGEVFNPHLDVGIMIEVPSAALIADRLAPHVDFFSVGTNDLVQYSMAVDRLNPDLSYLYQPGHPAIIRLLKVITDAAYEHGKWVGICGEMAADPLLVPVILGLGILELSMSPVSIPVVKRLIRHVRMHEAEALASQAMECDTAEEVTTLCRQFVARVAPELLQI